jgi:hypothetical protein
MHHHQRKYQPVTAAWFARTALRYAIGTLILAAITIGVIATIAIWT